MTKDYKPELACAVHAAKTAGARLRRAFHSGESHVDTRAEQEIHQILSSAFPHYGYRGEELGPVRTPEDSTNHHSWLVDPDDGTAAFDKGYRGAAVSIALLRDARPVLGVVYAYCAPDDHGDLFTWAEGMDHIERNGRAVPPLQHGSVPDTVLVSHRADENSLGNALAVAPMRFRAVPSIAYRLALVAAGEARAANSLNGPTGWDYAGGHALLLGAGLDLYDARGESIRYDRTGESSCSGRCFGGSRPVVQQLLARDWQAVFRRRGGEPEAATPYPLFSPKRRSTVDDAGLLARAQGCLLGQLAGDALGGLVEFQTGQSIQSRHPEGVRKLIDGGHWGTLGGQPTDDSEMALALARSIIIRPDNSDSPYDPEAAAAAYRWWYKSGPYDIGHTTATALATARSVPSQDSQANGALMRVSPLGILGAAAGAGAPQGTAAGDWAQQDARITHPHPVCQQANRVFAETLAFAIRTGSAPEEVYRFALQQSSSSPAAASAAADIHDVIVQAATQPPADYYTKMGWVKIALQNAFWQLLHAKTLEQGIVDTVMAGGDTDTNAAIAGALLGAVHGRPGIPFQWLDRILTCRPLTGLTGVRHPRPEAFWPVDALWIAEHLLWLGMNQRGSSSSSRESRAGLPA